MTALSFRGPSAGPVDSKRLAAGRSAERGQELMLIVMALVVVAGYAAAVDLGATGRVGTGSWLLPAGLAVIFVAAHVVVRRFARHADPVLLPCAVLINGVGVIFLHRLDLVGTQGAASTSRVLVGLGVRQLAWTAGAVVVFALLLGLLRDYRAVSRYAYTFALAGCVLVVIPVLLPARFSEVYGSKLWIRVGGFSIQPGEFAKLALMVFFAYYLVRKREVLALASRRVLGLPVPRGRDLGPVLAVWVASMLVLASQKDFGMALMYFGIFVAMLYIATERVSWVLIGLVLFAAGSVASYQLYPRLHLRVSIWLHPFADPNGDGYQLVQGLLGLGTGGLFGTGPGTGRPDLVPEVHNDFIVAGIGEEIGLFGLTALLTLYVILVIRGLRIALMVKDSFGKLLAGGLAFSLGLQVFVIVGGVTGLIPLTGQTTPLLSGGGSSLLATWIVIAVLLRISDTARAPLAARAHPQPVSTGG
jgi:cell division protein FtsW (lipid II flippase)